MIKILHTPGHLQALMGEQHLITLSNVAALQSNEIME